MVRRIVTPLPHHSYRSVLAADARSSGASQVRAASILVDAELALTRPFQLPKLTRPKLPTVITRLADASFRPTLPGMHSLSLPSSGQLASYLRPLPGLIHHRSGRIAMAGVLGGLLGVAAPAGSSLHGNLVAVTDEQSTITALHQADAETQAHADAVTQALAAAYRPAQVAPVALPPLQFTRHLEVQRGETLAATLRRAGFNGAQTQKLISSLGDKAPTKLRAGTEMTLSYTESQPYQIDSAKLTFRPQPDMEVRLALSGTPALPQVAADFHQKPLVEKQSVAVGYIGSSLYADATNAGLSPAQVKQFMDIFAFDIDYTRDIHPGDLFRVTYEETVADTGERIKTGRILAAAFTVDGETRQAFWYDKGHGTGEYLNEKGEGKRKLLLRTPLETYRISSNFNLNRKHPVLGYTRAHRGTDFAAPIGTPVKASGDGVVEQVARRGGYGNYVRVRHNDTFSTAYAHLSRYARGLRPGQRVSQGQIIAYVGNTGVSSGPHLHYEVIKNGTQVDAMRTDLPTGSMLAARDRQKFLNQVTQTQLAWAKALTRTQLASR